MTDNSQALMMALQAGSLYGPNKWSQFPNGIQGTSYSGTPTNALGQPIQQPPGMTLNQTPAQPQAAPRPRRHSMASAAALIIFEPTASQPNGMPQGWNQNSNNGGIFITPTQQSQPQQQAAAAAPQRPAHRSIPTRTRSSSCRTLATSPLPARTSRRPSRSPSSPRCSISSWPPSRAAPARVVIPTRASSTP